MKSLLNLVQDSDHNFSENTPYLLIWLNEEDISFDANYENINDILEMLHLCSKTDVILDKVCEECKPEQAEYLRSVLKTTSANYSIENMFDEPPLIEPIQMSKSK